MLLFHPMSFAANKASLCICMCVRVELYMLSMHAGGPGGLSSGTWWSAASLARSCYRRGLHC